MKNRKNLRKPSTICIFAALLLVLTLLLSACGKKEASLDYLREEGVSAPDYYAKVLLQDAAAREKFVAALYGYNMSAEGFDDDDLPEITAETEGIVEVRRTTDPATGATEVYYVSLDGARAALLSIEPKDDATKAKYNRYLEELTADMIPEVVEKMQTKVEIDANNGPIDTLLVWIGKFLQILTKMTGGYYVLALFIFAIIVEILMLPFSVKQQKSSIKQMKLRPKEMAIRKKYAGRNDQVTMQKMQAELQKMYQEEGFNPMGGCLPLLIQLPLVLALYNIVIDPLKYVIGTSTSFSEALMTYATTAKAAGGLGMAVGGNGKGTIELLSQFGGSAPEGFKSFRFFSNSEACFDVLQNARPFPNFSLFGQNMGLIPGFQKPWILLLVPVLTFVVYFFSMKLNRKFSYQPAVTDAQTGCSNNMMDIGMPLMSVYIAFVVPAAVGIYWIFKSIIGTLKQYLLHVFMPLPVFTEADYKAAEREMKGKKPKNQPEPVRPVSTKPVRSLHHIDDDDEALPPPVKEPDEPEEKPTAGQGIATDMAAPLKDDRKDSGKDDRKDDDKK